MAGFQFRKRERGATLIICMIILVVITFLGVGSIQDTTMEEKMAGNMKNKNMAFQSAESALRRAEDYLSSTAILPDFDGTSPNVELIPQISGSETPPIGWATSQWAASAAASGVGAIGDVAEAPRYVIEKLSSVASTPSLEAGQPEDTDEFYRITTRAVGGTSTAVVVVQSIYKR